MDAGRPSEQPNFIYLSDFVCAEFRSFVLNQDNNRRQWLAAEQNAESLQDTVKRLQSENAKLDTQVKHAR